MKPPPGLAERLAWQWVVAERPVLNVGCESDPAHFGTLPDTVNVDVDMWEQVNGFFRGDARALPFPGKTFDTVLLCECLDHMEQPWMAITEARRLAQRLVVITLPADDGGTEDPSHWVQHIELLKTMGLKELAPGNHRLRHGHSMHWTITKVFDLMSAAGLDGGFDVKQGGDNPPEFRVLVTP